MISALIPHRRSTAAPRQHDRRPNAHASGGSVDNGGSVGVNASEDWDEWMTVDDYLFRYDRGGLATAAPLLTHLQRRQPLLSPEASPPSPAGADATRNTSANVDGHHPHPESLPSTHLPFPLLRSSPSAASRVLHASIFSIRGLHTLYRKLGTELAASACVVQAWGGSNRRRRTLKPGTEEGGRWRGTVWIDQWPSQPSKAQGSQAG